MILILAVLIVIFHLYTGAFGTLVGYIQAPIHWMFVSAIAILARPSRFRFGAACDALLIGATCAASLHHIRLQEFLVMNPARYTALDVAVSAVAVTAALLIGVRVLGKALPAIAVVCILYAYLGNRISGPFQTAAFSAKRIVTYLFTMGDGLYGMTLLVSARFLMLFLFFGGMMEVAGTGQFFVDVANSIAGRVRGGPAQAAVYSSMLMGMVSGSGAANVATTGTFTIPLMKKSGYSASVAGAVEATASCGGQIMPPVMGAVAFLMSEATGIPYSKIAVASLIPAVLYYISLSASVYGFARRAKMEKPDPATLPSLGKTLRVGWYYAVPLLVIIGLIFSGRSAQRSVFWAIAATFLIILIFQRNRLSLRALAGVCRKSALSCGPLATACMLAGIIMGMINLTGLGLRISSLLQIVARGSLLVTLILAMLTSVLLGMGLPTSAAYVVLSVLIAPALTQMGVGLLPAHLFILYYGALSTITPPVALSTFTAAGISGAGIWETGRDALRISAAGFIVPFIFTYNDELLLIGRPGDIAVAVITAILGCYFVGSAVSGWCLSDLTAASRIVLLPCSVMLIVVRPLWVNAAGFVLATAVILFNRTVKRKGGGHGGA